MGNDKQYALIVAGGKSTRLPGQVPKQFMEVRGKPILIHTMEAFDAYAPNLGIVVVLPRQEVSTWQQLCKKHSFGRTHEVAIGGASRFQSVRNGLALIEGEGLVAIHDGVRPLVSAAIIGRSFELAAIHGAAVATVPSKDSLRKRNGKESVAVDRSQYYQVQTPQTFKISIVKDAYKLKEQASFTDDAVLVEQAGQAITLFEGCYRNIKITSPEDLSICDALMNPKQAKG